MQISEGLKEGLDGENPSAVYHRLFNTPLENGENTIKNESDERLRDIEIKKCPECSDGNLIYDSANAELYCNKCGVVFCEDLSPQDVAPRLSPEVYFNAGVKYRSDIKGLRGTGSHKGESEKKIQRELPMKWLFDDISLQIHDAEKEVTSFLNGVGSEGFKIEKNGAGILKAEIRRHYTMLQNVGLFKFGRKSIKLNVMACLFYLAIPDVYRSQIDSNPTYLEAIKRGREAIRVKNANWAGGTNYFFDKYQDFLFEPEKIRASFRDNVPPDVMEYVWQAVKIDTSKLYHKISNIELERAEKKEKGVNYNYLSLLIFFYIIKKKGAKKLLKTIDEIAKIWDIPLRTFKRKIAFLHEIDV